MSINRAKPYMRTTYKVEEPPTSGSKRSPCPLVPPQATLQSASQPHGSQVPRVELLHHPGQHEMRGIGSTKAARFLFSNSKYEPHLAKHTHLNGFESGDVVTI